MLRYADRADAVVDVHLPPDGPGDSLIVLLHGGFWRTAYDRTHTRPLARALAEDGWVVATPEYRRVGPGNGGGGGWPTTATDVRTAVQQLPGLLAGRGIRPTRTVALGHSAGGHLALWLANEPVGLDRVVALAPVSDLTEADRLHLGSDATRALLGGGPDEVDYRPADPMTRLRDRPTAKIIVVHGTEDENVPVSLSRGLVRAHAWVELRELPGVGHFELIDPADPAYRTVRDAL